MMDDGCCSILPCFGRRLLICSNPMVYLSGIHTFWIEAEFITRLREAQTFIFSSMLSRKPRRRVRIADKPFRIISCIRTV